MLNPDNWKLYLFLFPFIAAEGLHAYISSADNNWCSFKAVQIYFLASRCLSQVLVWSFLVRIVHILEKDIMCILYGSKKHFSLESRMDCTVIYLYIYKSIDDSLGIHIHFLYCMFLHFVACIPTKSLHPEDYKTTKLLCGSLLWAPAELP